ncbi:energy transducer TonB [Oscillatoria sp. HE19RPO]|uniref:energy transducer TonB n=1 Tax=Oscillatoria sp. HE19RPO TaxID=2954806 RepID=UPI0020C3F745|nr:TonB family protein [Oscillatoria sp. HE19RPO]
MTVSTVAAKGREQQEKQIARFIKVGVMGSAVVHLAALVFVMPLINVKSDGTEDPIEFIVLEESPATPEELMPESEAAASATPEAIASATPEPVQELMPESEAIAEPTPEPVEELMPESEAIAQLTPEPVQELMPESEAIAEPTPEPVEELMPEPEAIAEPTSEPEAIAEPTPEPEAIAEPTPEPTPEPIQELMPEPEPLDRGPETPSAEVPEAIATPRSDLRAEPLPRQRPPEPVTNPAPMRPEEMSPLTNSSGLDPGHNSRIANDDRPDSTLTEPVNPGRLPEVPDVKIVQETRGEPSPVRYDSPFNPGAIASGDSDDPWESNLARLSEPWNESEVTPEENTGQFPGVEADSTLGGTRSLGEESGLEAIACQRCDPPPYPQIALDNAWEGTVILSVDIAPDGTVISAEIQQSSGYSILDDAAQMQVETWRFDPSEQGQQGRVIPVPFGR